MATEKKWEPVSIDPKTGQYIYGWKEYTTEDTTTDNTSTKNFDRTAVENSIKQYFKSTFDREYTDADVTAWADQIIATSDKQPTPKEIVAAMDASAKELLVGKYKIDTGEEKKDEKVEETTDAMDWIKELYGSMQPEIEAGVKSAAAGRGGLDTGGYLTSMGKAKASTWQDMLKAMIGQYNTSNQLNLSNRQLAESARQFNVGQENTNQNSADYYKLLTAQSKASEPSAWTNILAGASAGGTVGGPIGAIIGGLAGWGSKQGFFG